jgi:hypothetical protein
MFSSKEFEKLCTPAKVYFTIAVFSILIGLFSGFNFMAVLGKLIFAVIYTFVLGWLCSKGWKSLSWFLVLLPYVLILITFFGFVSLNKNQMHTVNQISGKEQIKEGLRFKFPRIAPNMF